MSRRIAVLAVLCALALSCDPLSRTEMTLTFDESGENVTVDVVSDENHLKTYHAEDRDHVGEDVLAGRDEWSPRFTRANPRDERVVLNRTDGTITRVENQASIKTADLQKFFYDIGATVQVEHGEGWTELTLYPGASTRANSKQKATVERGLDRFAHLAVDYFDALRDMYRYMDANEARTEELFYGVFAEEKDEKADLSEKEKLLAERVRSTAMAMMEFSDKDSKELPRLADLLYNPFPAVLDVRVPNEPMAVEGFEKQESGMLRATTAMPDEALKRLEGRWVSPDLFAALERRDKDATNRQFAAELAKEPRKFAPVVRATDIVDALVKGMQPAARYRVRWSTAGTPSREVRPGTNN